MPVLSRYRLRHLRRHAIYALAVLLVVVAVLVGSLNQLLPLVERHPDKVAAWLSARAGQPVAFDHLDTAWTRRGPLLRLDGLRIGQGEGVRIGQAEVLVSLYSGLLPGAPLTELRLRGLALTLQRADDGRWSVRGLPTAAAAGDPMETVRRLGELQVIGGRLRLDAPSLGLDTELPRIDLRLRVDGDRIRAGARAWIAHDAAPVTAVVDFQRQRGDGTAWIAAAPADLSAWRALLHVGGLDVRRGTGTIRTWVALNDHRVASVIADATLERLELAGAPFAAGGKPPVAGFDSLRLRARWRQDGDRWYVDAPQLRVATGTAGSQVLDGLHLGGGREFALRGRRIDATPLLRVAALSDAVEPGLRHWLYRAAPVLRFADVDIAGQAGGAMHGAGELEEAAFAAVAGSPGLSGLRGRFEGDGQAVALRLQPAHPLRFDWPTGFGVVHTLKLDGQAVVWREGAGWHVATPAMRVQGNDYAANVRGGLWFQGDGTRPWISLAAQLDDVPITAAKGFWVRSHMSQAAVDWLDGALVDGQLRGGVGLAVGDLDDWPFDGNDGRFEAGGRIDNGTLRFSHGWPAMSGVDADITFIANGFALQGKGSLGGVKVDAFRAGIADFHESRLKVDARTLDDSGHLLALLRQSPLQGSYGETLDALSANGPAAVDFGLSLPLRGGEGQVSGTVELRGATLADRRWDLRFDNVRGKAEYASDGFRATALQVRHREHDGVLSLSAGSPVGDPGNAFEAELTSSLAASDLLDRAPELKWLQPYVHGTSRWTIGVALPKAAAGSRVAPPTTLSLRSDLQGTRLQLPAPLDKPAADTLPTRVTASLPLGSGTTEVAFGRRLALAARTHNGRTGVQVTLGSDRVSREPPADGLVVDGRTPSLDALEWIGLARGQGGAGGADADGVALKQVDVLADQLLLVGGRFEQTRLRLRPGKDAVAVQLEGPSLAGDLSFPAAEGGTVSGTLARVHWQAATAVAGEAGDRPADPVDPARVPPLALDIGDLSFGKAELGQTTLRTRPLADGLQVSQLQFRSPKQAIDVTGQWRGTGAQARTRFEAAVRSENLGGLLDNLGYGGQLRGGQGQLQFNAGWDGAPAAFNLAGLEGTLDIDIRNGQILEVEPGAGRVLGLLSVAQLPRRLLLDFRDFFSKGLAFNHAEGRVAFGDGLARTDRIGMQGPAADITIRGQADLRAQRFDQTVEVNPRSGNLLTVVGAVAGGPVGAAVGAAANAVLGKPLGEIGARTYRVTGPWSDPKVEVVDRDAPRLPPPAQQPAGAGSP
ncbi:YhdP family protein [Stenotrophomonas acidaminiphila]|uniref:YhdP family protein n=1 Tax=Stenotrophomonas TaxID=40323 RepID=UPI0028A990EF|nr:YhdP family protein [Stenotrophomonas acidaminiphila]